MKLQEFREVCLSCNLKAIDESCFQVDTITQPTFRYVSENVIEVTYTDENEEKVTCKLSMSSDMELLTTIHQMMSIIIKKLYEKKDKDKE